MGGVLISTAANLRHNWNIGRGSVSQQSPPLVTTSTYSYLAYVIASHPGSEYICPLATRLETGDTSTVYSYLYSQRMLLSCVEYGQEIVFWSIQSPSLGKSAYKYEHSNIGKIQPTQTSRNRATRVWECWVEPKLFCFGWAAHKGTKTR